MSIHCFLGQPCIVYLVRISVFLDEAVQVKTEFVFLLQSEATGGLSCEDWTSETQTVQHPDSPHHPPNPKTSPQCGCQPADTWSPQLCLQEGPAQEGMSQTRFTQNKKLKKRRKIVKKNVIWNVLNLCICKHFSFHTAVLPTSLKSPFVVFVSSGF